MNRSVQKQVGGAVVWSVLARSGRFTLGLASSIIVVRLLGDHDYGVLSLVRAVLGFVTVIAGVGLGQSLLKFLPVLRVAGDRRGATRLVRRVLAVQTAAWAGLLVVTFLLRDRLEGVFRIDGVGIVLVIAVALSVFELMFRLVSHIFNAYYDTKLLSLANVVSHIVLIGLLLVLLPAGAGVAGAVAAGAAGQLVGTLMLLRRAAGLFDRTEVGQPPEPAVDPGRVFRFAIPFAAIALLNVIVWRQSELLFLAHYRGAVETGFFDLAYRIPQTLLEFVPATVWPIVMAGLSEVYATNRANLSRAIEKYYKMLFLLTTPICIYGVALGGRLIPILFGVEMSTAAVPAQLFFLIFTVSFFGTPLSMTLYAIEKSYVNLLVYLCLAAVNVGLDLILIPRFGITGAIIPVAFVVILTPFVYKVILDRMRIDVRIPYRFIAKCFLTSSPLLLILPFAGLVAGVTELVGATAVAGIVVLFSAKLTKLIGKEESDMLGSIPIPARERILKYMSA